MNLPNTSATDRSQSDHQKDVSRSAFFEPAKLGGLEKMQFSTSRRVEGSYSGRHVAKRRGGAGEFVDYREYSPGDDLRRIDWKVMGRTGRSYLKLFQDETDLRCTLVLDCSGSMQQGAKSSKDMHGSKLEWMQYFATALSHLILVGRDAVGMCSVRQHIDTYLPPVVSLQQRELLHRSIEAIKSEGETDLSVALDELIVQSSRRGVLLVISDFLVPNMDSVIASIRKFRSRGWEIITLHLLHPDEERLPEGNAFRFVGLEGDGEVNCQLAEIRNAYQVNFERHMKLTRTALVSAGCDYYRINTAENYLDVLRSFLVTRSG